MYANDVALLSWTPQGLQQLLDGMQGFSQRMGLIISPIKIQVVVFNRAAAAVSHMWHVGSTHLPMSESFKYLDLIFHESGSISLP